MKLRLMSVTLLVTLVMSAFVLAPTGAAAAPKAGKHNPFHSVKASGKFGNATVNVTHFDVNQAGQLVASGNVTDPAKGQLTTFSNAAVTVQQAPGAPCQVLDLVIQPITLNLLGLIVKTTTIHLNITGDPHQLLGALVCFIARLLDPRAVAQQLNQVVALKGGALRTGSPMTGLLPLQITNFFAAGNQLMARFNFVDAAGKTYGPFVTAVQAQAPAGTCSILHLVIHPLNLNILGVIIKLNGGTEADDIVIDIYLQPGPGNLLANLLCHITGMIANGAKPAAVAPQLNKLLGSF